MISPYGLDALESTLLHDNSCTCSIVSPSNEGSNSSTEKHNMGTCGTEQHQMGAYGVQKH